LILSARNPAEESTFAENLIALRKQERQDASRPLLIALYPKKFMKDLQRNLPLEINEKQRLSGMLGFATRAGKIIVGTDLVCRAMPSGKVKLVVVSRGASDSTKKKLTVKSEFYGIKSLIADIDTEELSRIVGKSSATAAVAVTEEMFSREILKLFAK